MVEERLYLMCLDSTSNLLRFTEISKGDKSRTKFILGTIARIAFEAKAVSLILIHNHASGIMAPSKADVYMTNKAFKAFFEK